MKRVFTFLILILVAVSMSSCVIEYAALLLLNNLQREPPDITIIYNRDTNNIFNPQQYPPIERWYQYRKAHRDTVLVAENKLKREQAQARFDSLLLAEAPQWQIAEVRDELVERIDFFESDEERIELIFLFKHADSAGLYSATKGYAFLDPYTPVSSTVTTPLAVASTAPPTPEEKAEAERVFVAAGGRLLSSRPGIMIDVNRRAKAQARYDSVVAIGASTGEIAEAKVALDDAIRTQHNNRLSRGRSWAHAAMVANAERWGNGYQPVISAATADSDASQSSETSTADSDVWSSSTTGIAADCTCKGIPLYGRVRVVTAFATFKVRITDAISDLDVEKTDFPSGCGEWAFVEVGEDFSVEFVDAFEDFSIRYHPFPGIN